MKKNLPLEIATFLFFLILPLVLGAAGPAAVKKKNEQNENASPAIQDLRSGASNSQASHPTRKRKCHHGRHRCTVSAEEFSENHPRDMPTTIFEDKPLGSKQSPKKENNSPNMYNSMEE